MYRDKKVDVNITLMKLLLFIITFSITFASSTQAVEYNKSTLDELKQMGVYFGNTLENKIIDQGDMYIVIHNPTELALTVMDISAKEYCKQKLGNQFTSKFMKLIGRYTAYFSCEMQNNIEQFNLTDEEIKCIEYKDLEFKNCEDFNKKNSDIVTELTLQIINVKKYKTLDFINSVRIKFYNQIEEAEQAAEDKRINKQIQKNIKICKDYNFEEGSVEYHQCILKLIELNYYSKK